MRWIQSGAVLVAALACLPAAAAAQPHPAIRVGQTMEGALNESDPALTGRGRFKVYRFDARAGQRLVATMRSGEFDAYLTVARVVAGITDPLAQDDDRGGGTDARVRFTAPATGSYLLVAQALSAEGMGPYTVVLDEAQAPTTAQPRELRIGQTVSGSLADTDAILEEDDTYYDTWVLSGQAGQRLMVEMKSDSFDTYLSFGRMEGEEFNSSSSDDDGGEGTDSRVRVTLPETGEYVIRANSIGGGATGPYTLAVTERAPPGPPPPPQPISIGGPEVTGALEDSDPTMDDESYYDYWSFTGRAGDRLRIAMRSEEFDTFLALGQLAGGTFTEIASNDDAGDDGTNSIVDITLPTDGTYVIRANSFSGGSTGAYRLRVERLVEQ
ncbi:MAG TPA: PPC domain-containing protein [Longimicrobiaceae bacterium]|nr:PPC domain-containing protein [Longimicrobiaceae bacterium]